MSQFHRGSGFCQDPLAGIPKAPDSQNFIVLDTIAELRAYRFVAATFPEGQLIFVKGYYSAEDGGGGFFNFHRSGSVTDNGGTIIIPSSGFGYYSRLLEEGQGMNVLWFGAKADGATDSYDAVVSAMESLPETGGEVFFPDSDLGYKFSAQISTDRPVIFKLGSGLFTGPDSGYIFSLSHNGSKLLGAGTGVTTLKIINGSDGAVINSDALGTTYKDFTIDLNDLVGVSGFYQQGGWYVNVESMEILQTRTASGSVGFKVYSRDIGGPGSTGSYGGSYVSVYNNVRTKNVLVDSDGVNVATTLTFINLDSKNVTLARCKSMTFIQPVVQAAGDNNVLWDITSSDNIRAFSGDFERGDYVGGVIIWKLTGTVRGLRSQNNMLANFNVGYTDTYVSGTIYDGNIFDDYGAAESALITGTNATAANRYKNNGYSAIHRVGVDYDGLAVNLDANLVQTGALQGDLVDVANGGAIFTANTSGVAQILAASAGANPRALRILAQFDDSGGRLPTTMGVYADNAAALLGGLTAGALYRTSTGTLQIVY